MPPLLGTMYKPSFQHGGDIAPTLREALNMECRSYTERLLGTLYKPCLQHGALHGTPAREGLTTESCACTVQAES